MSEKRIQFNKIIQSQLPAYIRTEFPLVAEFLKQYYISQEFEGSSIDLIQNIDQYIKLDTIKNSSEFTLLKSDLSFVDDVITVENTDGFPDSYGLIQIDDEIITYTGKTSTSFVGCIRGFSGVTSYNTENKTDQLIFTSTESSDHVAVTELGDSNKVINLSSLFLKEFFNKIKYQLSPGFENREFYSGLNKYLFLKQSKDFYSTRGTDLSFKILFKVLYGEDVRVVKPKDYLTKPSDAQYQITNDLVVESVSGNPYELERSTLKQDTYGDIQSGYAPISRVERIYSQSGKFYYKLSFDGGYNRDIRVDGSLYGNFSVHPKTKIIGNVSQGAKTLDVDSTVGFPSQGELFVIYPNGLEGIISYTEKNINQFFGCNNITSSIPDGTEISLNTFAYGESNTNSGEIIKVKITSVLKDVEDIEDSYYQEANDVGIIKTLGANSNDIVSNNWVFNSATSNVVSSIAKKSNETYEITTSSNHNLRKDDSIILISDNKEIFCNVITINSNKIFVTKISEELNLKENYSIKRNILKFKSKKYLHLTDKNTNVQNVYKIKENTLVASSSLPSYENLDIDTFDKSIEFSGTFSGDIFKIGKHNFYTGDSVYYIPEESSSLFEEGIYFVARVDSSGRISNKGDSDSVKFTKSRPILYDAIKGNSSFISVNPTTVPSDKKHKLVEYDFYNKKLESQKILREISAPINDGNVYNTNPGTTGILINGVEILNYKSKDKIYYGSIEDFNVVNPGFEYDVINPPVLIISDAVGTGATGYVSVKGSLKEIRIVDPGFDYIETPKINISGGNGFGANATAIMKSIDHEVSFNSQSNSSNVDIVNDSIGFGTYHKFRLAEKVSYITKNQSGIGGITTNSSYYVSIPDPYKIKLHKTYEDALSGINTIPLTSYGVGNHTIKSNNKKLVISSIVIENEGTAYENKKRTVNSSGINTSLELIQIKNHGFKSGEIIKYSSMGSVIGGLTNDSSYYVTKVDENNFKLSLIGVGTDNQDFYYKTNQFIDLTSSGIGTHVFNYPPITVEVVGNVGIHQISGNNFKAQVQPIFRGEITSVHLERGGVGYGSSEIINFNKIPTVTLSSGSECKVVPIINNGRITEVLVTDFGSGYNSPPNLNIITNGNGFGAVLCPILQNGQVKSVKVIDPGAGYDKNSTSIIVISSGYGSEIVPNLKSWTINLFAKYQNRIQSDDGFIFYNSRSKYELQYAHLYAPRKLRENLYSIRSDKNVLYGKTDLTKSKDGIELSSKDHSPIIGWAYDGNPIYGPYGYSGGDVVQMKSGYVLNKQSDRPSFPDGFFIEDYEYRNTDKDYILDEFNGRFCTTPDFPNGTYAYFATVEESSESDGNFKNYKSPQFPYFIGNKFKSIPNEFNFKRGSNQDDIDLNKTNWKRNTYNYNLLGKDPSYSYINLPNNLNQVIDVKYASPGSVEKIEIISGGENYKVNDRVLFDDEGTNGFGFASKVSRVHGKQVNSVSASSTTFYNLEIYSDEKNIGKIALESILPHSFYDGEIVSVSGINTSLGIDGFYNVGISSNTFAISNPSGIGSTSITGIVTYISVSGNILYSDVKENDIFSIENEKIKILNIDKKSSRFRVLRNVDGAVGVGTSHAYGTILYQKPRRIYLNSGSLQNILPYSRNREIYFDPKESLGIGTGFGVGIGTTIKFSNPGVGITQIFIPTKSIYIPNHNLKTGDQLIYSKNTGSEISVSIDGINSTILSDQSNVYVAKLSDDLIGISTVIVGLGSTGTFVGIASTQRSSTTLYLTGTGSGTYHSFKTNYTLPKGQVSKNIVTVSTAQTHGLTNNDEVFVNVNSGLSTNVIIKYNDTNRMLLVNPKNFVSGDINIAENTITIPNHNFINGQKVIYNSTSPSGGLVNDQIYYIVIFTKDSVKLTTSYYESTKLSPQVVNITSASNGTLSPVNPPITLFENSTITFDLSDSSLSQQVGSSRYSSFELNFYLDSNFTQEFNSTSSNTEYEVQKIGRVGIDSEAKVLLKISDSTPKKLFYKLDLININLISATKKEIVVDNSVSFNNQIEIISSGYNGKYPIVSTSSTSFEYNVLKFPEASSYDSGISYDTSSKTASGSISKIDITSGGQNYYSVPKFLNVVSNFGKNALLEASSKSIGKLNKTKINDIGFDFPSDSTLKPNVSFPYLLKIDPFNSLDYIGITSVGNRYIVAPKLIVLDGKTRKIVPEIDLQYNLGDSNVTILNNGFGLNGVTPIIIPTQNSNGIEVSSIIYNPSTKNATLYLSVGFSTNSSFPFSVGDNILIENTSVGVNSTGKGFNSENYDYRLFTVIGVDTNIGGYGNITYNLSDFLGDNEFPGTYDTLNSRGRVIPEKYFPTFNPVLKSNLFLEGEEIRYSDSRDSDIRIGRVKKWSERTKTLKVSSRETIENGKIIEGLLSKSKALVSSSINFDSFINIGSYSKVENGWDTNTGFLNTDLQRLQDNFYYQNFSYSLRSRVTYDDWQSAVGSLNHTSGFKKFSDYQLESNQYCGIKTDTISTVSGIVDINGFASLNCVYDFDLARENSLNINNQILSDEITFNGRVLTDYFESVGNRVLSIDNIDENFDNNERERIFSEVDRFVLSKYRAQKYIGYIKDKRYANQRQFLIFTVLHDGQIGYINQYGRVETEYDMGSFDFELSGTRGFIYFYPSKYQVNDFSITTLSTGIKDNFVGIATTSIGGLVDITTETIPSFSTQTTIASLSNNYTSSKILTTIKNENNYQFNELNIIHDGTNVESELLGYGQLDTNSNLGEFDAYFSGSELKVDFIPNSGSQVSVSKVQISIANTNTVGVSTFYTENSRLEVKTTSILSSSSPTTNVVGQYPIDTYESGYFIVQVSDITNNSHQLSEIVVVNDSDGAYITEFANIETDSSLGTFTAIKNPNDTQLLFTPIPNVEIQVKVYSNNLSI